MSGKRFRVGRIFGLVASMLALTTTILSSAAARAATDTWTGGGGNAPNNVWSNATNWTGGVPANDGSEDIHFAGVLPSSLTSDVDSAYNINSLNFDSGAGAFALIDNPLTIQGGGVVNNSSNTQTINNSIVLGTPQTWNAASGNLVFGGTTITAGGNLLTIDGAQNTNISGAITGTAGITKNGTGTLLLSGNNSGESGPVIITAGTIQAGSNTSLPDVNYTLSGGSLDLNNFNATITSLSGASASSTVNLESTSTLTDTTSGSDTYAGTITSSGGTFVLNGTGTLTLGNANNQNTFGSGNIDVLQGTLQSGATGSLPTANYEVNGILAVNNGSVTALALTGSNSGQITLGTGSLTIANPGTSTYSGTVNGGAGSAINMFSGNQELAGAISGATAVNANGGTLILSGTNTFTGGTNLNTGGTVSVSTDANLGNNGSAVNFLGGTLEVTGTTLTNLDNHTINATAFNGGFQIDDASNNFTVNQSLSGSGALSKSGDGTLVLTGTNTYSGGTNVSDGTLKGTTDSIQGNINAAGTGIVAFTNTTNGTYSGAISGTGGNVEMDGSATVTFTGNNSYTGTTTINTGTLQVGNGGTTGSIGTGAVINEGALIYDRSDPVTVANAISGVGSFTQNGTGLLSLGGTDTYTGPSTVNAGQLNVDGSTTSNNTTVASGATLGGIGTINGNVSNSGTISPGNSGSTANTTGTLTVTGDVTNAVSGTKMNVVVNDANAQNVSKLVASGNVSVNNATVHVDLSSGNFDKSGTTVYTFLTDGTRTGSFASAVTTSQFVTATLDQSSPTDVSFTLTANFSPAATTFNQTQVANYLNTNVGNVNADFQALINTLSGLTTAQVANALTQISGDIHPTMAQLNVNGTSLVIGQVAARLRAAPFAPGGPLAVADNGSVGRAVGAPIALVSEGPDGEPEMQSCPSGCGPQGTAWGMGFGMGGSAESDGNATAASFGMGGVVAGMERWADDCHLLGFYGAYVGADLNAVNGQTANINGGQFGGYMFADDGFNYYTVLGGFEFDGDSTTRNLSIDTIVTQNTSNYGDWQSFLYAERGVSFERCNYVLQPFVAVQYIFVRQNSFTESGASNTALDLQGGGDTTNSLRSMVGARLQYALTNRNGRRTLPEIHAMWLHEYLDADSSVTATMVPVGGSPFIVRGLDMGRDWGVVGANLTWEMVDGWSMFVNYDLQTNTKMTLNAGSGGLGYRW
ncbi:MAG TPA: autotransporter domain-containing protein [Pirellulales bacterium]|jgi:outer membrane autotransporter protein|nr:autotransporter domain-containing protein [Pirellulales bacterium]